MVFWFVCFVCSSTGEGSSCGTSVVKPGEGAVDCCVLEKLEELSCGTGEGSLSNASLAN